MNYPPYNRLTIQDLKNELQSLEEDYERVEELVKKEYEKISKGIPISATNYEYYRDKSLNISDKIEWRSTWLKMYEDAIYGLCNSH